MDVPLFSTLQPISETQTWLSHSLRLKWFSDSSSQFGENLQTSVVHPLPSGSYISFSQVLLGLLLWTILFISLWHCSLTLHVLRSLPGLFPNARAHLISHLHIHLASSTSSCETLKSHLWELSVLSVLFLLLMFAHCLQVVSWYILYSVLQTLGGPWTQRLTCISQFPTSRTMPGT